MSEQTTTNISTDDQRALDQFTASRDQDKKCHFVATVPDGNGGRKWHVGAPRLPSVRSEVKRRDDPRIFKRTQDGWALVK